MGALLVIGHFETFSRPLPRLHNHRSTSRGGGCGFESINRDPPPSYADAFSISPCQKAGDVSHQTSIRLNWNNSVLSGGGRPGKHEGLVTWVRFNNFPTFVCLFVAGIHGLFSVSLIL